MIAESRQSWQLGEKQEAGRQRVGGGTHKFELRSLGCCLVGLLLLFFRLEFRQRLLPGFISLLRPAHNGGGHHREAALRAGNAANEAAQLLRETGGATAGLAGSAPSPGK